MFLAAKIDPELFDRTRMAVTDVVAPFLEALSRPIASGAAIVDEVNYLVDLRGKNAVLRMENARLIQWLEADHGWDRWKAYDLLTHVGRISVGYYGIGTVATKIERRYLQTR